MARLTAALEPDYVVLGGGNVKKLKNCRPAAGRATNANAFRGGFRLWEQSGEHADFNFSSFKRQLHDNPLGIENAHDTSHRTTHAMCGVEGPRSPSLEDPRDASPETLRGRPRSAGSA